MTFPNSVNKAIQDVLLRHIAEVSIVVHHPVTVVNCRAGMEKVLKELMRNEKIWDYEYVKIIIDTQSLGIECGIAVSSMDDMEPYNMTLKVNGSAKPDKSAAFDAAMKGI